MEMVGQTEERTDMRLAWATDIHLDHATESARRRFCQSMSKLTRWSSPATSPRATSSVPPWSRWRPFLRS